MRPSPKPQSRTLTVLLAAVVLVGGANLAAYAANGRPLLIGQSNTGTKATTLENTRKGPALVLTSKGKGPSLKVSGQGTVTNLSADRVDGYDARDLMTTAYRYGIPSSGPYDGEIAVTFPGLPEGQYLMAYSIITSTNGSGTQCYARQSDGATTAQAMSWSANAGGYSSNNATALVDTRGDAGPLTLYCYGVFSFYSGAGDAESTVAFTPVDSITQESVGLPARARARTTSGGVTR
ncbi:hypothetical protein [Nocardioides taihuensis]|uniref:Uncharacterized protein n=1 Tax=Nocardioides taihuensis TaxID=1835606 RepID=A0ABW0BKJ4_9ACTN